MGYDDIPWIFKGRALYQLQFVKSEVARQYVPPDLKLVELFGYTLGGFYLARYNDSPAGAFDELVVMSGLVWNAPTSCAWAARVYVNNKSARDHGLKHIGLPSRLAQFVTNSVSDHKEPRQIWWQPRPSAAMASLSVKNVERRGWLSKNRGLKPSVCTFVLDSDLKDRPKGPRIKLSLPSFSGCTPELPKLLKYACRLDTNVRPVKPLKLHFEAEEDPENDELMTAVLKGRPLCSLLFDDMTMSVNPPTMIEHEPVQRLKEKWIPAACHF